LVGAAGAGRGGLGAGAPGSVGGLSGVRRRGGLPVRAGELVGGGVGPVVLALGVVAGVVVVSGGVVGARAKGGHPGLGSGWAAGGQRVGSGLRRNGLGGVSWLMALWGLGFESPRLRQIE